MLSHKIQKSRRIIRLPQDIRLPNKQSADTSRHQRNQDTGKKHIANIPGYEVVLVVINEPLERANDHAECREVREGCNEYRHYCLEMCSVICDVRPYVEHDDELIRDELQSHVL